MELCFAGRAEPTARDGLVTAAAACGLGAPRVRERLGSDEDVERITQEADSAKEAGIDGVPCFIFCGHIAVPGAHAPEHLAQAIARAANEQTEQETAG